MVFGLGTQDKGNQNKASASIFDADAQNFKEKVLEASMTKPVIVDFWAPWCGPCMQLMPVLENIVNAAGGEVLLAKVNLDDNPQLAAALQVQSVPTVFGFYQGQPVDGFMGVQPESAIKQFIQNLVTLSKSAEPEAIDIPEGLEQAAAALSEGYLQAAQTIYAQILYQDKFNTKAFVGMVRVLIAAGEVDNAEHLINSAPEEIKKDRIFGEAETALDLAKNTALPADFEELEQRIKKKPDDHKALINLARGMFAGGQKERACELLLQSIEKDLKWNEEEARKELIKFFEAMGHTDPITIDARRKLSSILFS